MGFRNESRIFFIIKIPLSEKAQTEEPILIAQGWASCLLYSPIHKKLISATQMGDVLEIYDINDTSSVVSYGKTADPKFAPIQESYSIPIGLMGHSDIQITDKYIYTIFFNPTKVTCHVKNYLFCNKG